VEFPDHLKSESSNKDDWATNGMAHRNSKTRNVVKSLYLDPVALNDNNLQIKAKCERMQKEDIQYEAYHMDGDYQALIVSYGTMSRVCKTAVDDLAQQGIEVGLLRPQTLYPFPEEAIRLAAGKKSCRIVLCIEMSMGQMVEDVRRSVQGACPVQWYGKCGGDVPSPEEIGELVATTVGQSR
jgi:2-oxoglutarate ferredoxin oxidoreductase subunit alpha